MTVGKEYMLRKPPGPPEWKRAFDQQVVPLGIDAAAVLEAVVERVAVLTRGRPALVCWVGLGVGVWAGRMAHRR